MDNPVAMPVSAYELKLYDHWQIHSIMSIIQLKSTSSKFDFYNRSRSNYFDEIEVEKLSNTAWKKNYEIDHLVDRRNKKFDRINVIQYFVR